MSRKKKEKVVIEEVEEVVHEEKVIKVSIEEKEKRPSAKSVPFKLQVLHDELSYSVARSKVVGGWLVITHGTGGIASTFVPDDYHEWKVD